jgi:CBS domain-containing protein
MTKRVKEDEGYITNPVFIKQLLETNVMTLRPENNVTFICNRKDKILSVWRGLVRHGFQSVPVLSLKNDKWYGFLDMIQIVGLVSDIYGEKHLKRKPRIWDIETESELKDKLVDDIIHPIHRKFFATVKNNFSLLHVVELLARDKFERIPIINDEGTLVNLITQSHIVEYLSKHMNTLGTKKDKPIELFRNVFKEVFSIGHRELAIHAFSKMNKLHVHGCAVVNEKGELVNTLSVRDLKTILNDEKLYDSLLLTVHEFIEYIHSVDTNRPNTLITCERTDTLEHVIGLLNKHHLHRIFLRDPQKKIPIGVVGLKEVLYEIIKD